MTISGVSDPDGRWALGMAENHLIVGDSFSDTVRFFSFAQGEDIDTNDGSVLLQGPIIGDGFGATIAILPDRDGNGHSELLVGAPEYRVDFNSRADGAVFLIPDFLTETAQSINIEDQIRLVGSRSGTQLGQTLAVCADMDGDMIEEWVVAAPPDNAGEFLAGSVTLMLSSVETETIQFDREIEHRWTGSIRGELAGHSMSCNHDLTGDGIPDLAVGAPFSDSSTDGTGRIYILSGNELPPSGSLEDAALYILDGLIQDAWTGWSISTGDVNGDGYADVAAGAPGMENSRGWVLLWDGVDIAQNGALYPSHRIQGAHDGDRFGHRITLTDIDGDSIDDLSVSAPRESHSDETESQSLGKIYLFLGRNSWSDWRPQMGVDNASFVHESNNISMQGPLEMVYGDIDGDEHAELFVLDLDPKATNQ